MNNANYTKYRMAVLYFLKAFLVFVYLTTNGDNKLYITNKIYYTS